MKQDTLEYKQMWVGCFDLLGFRKHVEKYPLGYVLTNYFDALSEIRLQRANLDVNHKWFSDTFLFYTNDDSASAFWNIETACRFFYRSMFLRRVPLRGCLTVGEFYINEEMNIFIGPAMIDAYDLAVKQKWVGYVMAPNAIKRIETYDQTGRSLWEHLKMRSYAKCEVPYKEKKDMWACTMNIFEPTSDAKENDLRNLWNALIEMETIALNNYSGEGKIRDEIKQKYKNTKEFMLTVFPELKNLVKDINRQLPYR